MSATLRDLVLAARPRLAAAGIDPNEAALDAARLARHVLGWDLAQFIAYETEVAPEGFPAAFESAVSRRERREPMSAITRRREFWGLEFEVGPEVLAPRPETEIIVEEALACLRPAGEAGGDSRPLIVDVGTGSGCLAVCLAREFPGGAASSPPTSRRPRSPSPRGMPIATASATASSSGRPRCSTAWLGRQRSSSRIRRTFRRATSPAFRRKCASGSHCRRWTAGRTAWTSYARSSPTRRECWRPGGWLIMEFGYGQREEVERLIRASPLELVRMVNDLQQIPRTLVARTSGRR